MINRTPAYRYLGTETRRQYDENMSFLDKSPQAEKLARILQEAAGVHVDFIAPLYAEQASKFMRLPGMRAELFEALTQ